jgi:hypothetical protein
MKRIFVFLIVFAICLSKSFASENNFPISIILTTQNQVDNFSLNYPGVTHIDGNLYIGEYDECKCTDIVNLNGLNYIKSIGGNLNIHNTFIADLNGLDNLTSIKGFLSITSNDGLLNLNGLNNLESVSSILLGYDNYALYDIRSLIKIHYVSGDIAIFCDQIYNLAGLTNIDSIGGSLSLKIGELANIDSLANLKSIGGNLILDSNTQLLAVDGFENLSRIKGNLFINNNYRLKNLNGLSNLLSIDGYIYINQNSNLSDIYGIANIAPENIHFNNDNDPPLKDITITYNQALPFCAVQSICQALAVFGASYLIEGNATGCLESALSCVDVICTQVKEPKNDQHGVLVNTPIEWEASPNATGYLIAIGTTSGGSDLLDSLNVGNSLIYYPQNMLPCNSQIFVRIIPYKNNQRGNSCSESVFFTEKVEPVVSADTTVCPGIPVKLYASGGVSYQWTPSIGLDNPIISNPIATVYTATTYKVNVINERGCSGSSELTINLHSKPTTSMSSIHESGNDFNNGMASANPLSGTPPFSYVWNNGRTSKTIMYLNPGEYYVTVTDGNQCNTVDSVKIDKFICPELNIRADVFNSTCFNSCNGFINIYKVDNAVYPLIYNWSDGYYTSSKNSLNVGDYSVTITDSKNCGIVETFTIAEPEEMLIVIDSLHNMTGNSDGYIKIGGVNPNLKASWYGPKDFVSDKMEIKDLAAGCYNLTVTDTISHCFVDSTICISDLGSLQNVYKETGVVLYPNPASGYLNLDFKNLDHLPGQIIIKDMAGEDIIRQKIEIKQNIHHLDISKLNLGLYFVEILFEKDIEVFKIIVK